ncbi:nucleotidyltransferase family protein [Polynucleobacter sp. CS-Odin-A6]|uniref:nucleotidyltransferase family protein n=1 Tax=Polynucleobacter sp. CS-Odin-A6 TaxID=2689106 RepID=UPI001C0C90D9|nr:nucleotidyltransferase family protein [Polynucleobacter sp. CS-Odin-A6]MBU3621586.1 nucleotidyltransferase family protein [Polynucleobacter sp. CS-Odin-A6]
MTSSSLITQTPSLRLAVLLLVAGEGSRLGGHPKALLRKDGQTLLERFSKSIQGFNLVEFIAVTGFYAQAVEVELAKLNGTLNHQIKSILNIAPEKGHPSSVRLGLESLRSQFDVLLVALSDQPEIGEKEVAELLEEFSQRNLSEEIILPMVNGKRGNPVLFSRVAVLNTLKATELVCRSYMDAHPEQVRILHTQNLSFVLDVDTIEDIQRHKLSLS